MRDDLMDRSSFTDAELLVKSEGTNQTVTGISCTKEGLEDAETCEKTHIKFKVHRFILVTNETAKQINLKAKRRIDMGDFPLTEF